MEIIKKIEEVKTKHGQITQKLEELQKHANELVDESKRLQGEYRVFVRMGQEEGILDEEGNPIEKDSPPKAGKLKRNKLS